MKKVAFILAMLFGFAINNPLLSHAEQERRPAAAEPSMHKDEYEKSMEERLRRLGRQLDELKARAAAMTAGARKDADRYLKDAEAKQRKAKGDLERLRHESERKWKKFVAEMDAAMDEFEKAYDRAKAHFKE